MAPTLGDILAARSPRETSGSLAANRFDFQKNWVICHLLELHRDKNDYLVLCDYHEDVVVLDSEQYPQSASFYQIKTLKGKNWTLSSLLRRPKKSVSSSILGKLYANYLLLENATSGLHFVSNALFDVSLKNAKSSLDYRKIACDQLAESQIAELVIKVGKEAGVVCSLPVSPRLFFEVTALGIDGHETFTKGKLLEYFEEIAPGRKYPVTPAYSVLLDEVRRRTTYEGVIRDFSEIKKSKGIGRSTVEKMLSTFLGKIDLEEAWQEIAQRLTQEGVPPIALRRIRNGWNEYEIERMDPTNEGLQELRANISNISTRAVEANSETTLVDLCEVVLGQLGSAGFRSTDYIKAMTLMETYENLSLSKTNSESEEAN